MFKVIDNVKILMTAEELAELEAMGQAQPPHLAHRGGTALRVGGGHAGADDGRDGRWLSLSASSIVWAV